MTETVSIIALVVAALSMSVHFGTWLTERPIRQTTSGAVFTEIHQGRDAIAAKVMPVLGNAAILLVAITAIVVSSDATTLVISLVALALFVGDMAVTVTRNVPLNKQVQTWAVDSPPADWAIVRDRWERYHSLRTALIVVGFALLTTAVVLANT